MNFRNCGIGERLMLQNRHRDAVTYVALASERLIAFQAYLATAPQSIANLPAAGYVRTVHQALQDNFKTVASDHVQQISTSFQLLNRTMAQTRSLTYHCAPIVSVDPQTGRILSACQQNEDA